MDLMEKIDQILEKECPEGYRWCEKDQKCKPVDNKMDEAYSKTPQESIRKSNAKIKKALNDIQKKVDKMNKEWKKNGETWAWTSDLAGYAEKIEEIAYDYF